MGAELEAAGPAWAWEVRSEGELRKALEEYTEYVMAMGAPPDEGGDPDPTKRDRRYRIYAQNRAIDWGMARLRREKPTWWRLLDSYYRKGNWAEFRGWVETAKVVDIAGVKVPRCPGPVRCRVGTDNRLDLKTCESGQACQTMRDTFEVQVTLAVRGLFVALSIRRERAKDASG